MTQRTLTDYQPEHASEEATARTAGHNGSPYRRAHTGSNRYEHDSEDHAHPEDHCQHCGRPATIRARRVWGDTDDVLWRCPDCAVVRELQQGAGAGIEPAYPSRAPGHQDAIADGGDTR